MGGGSAMTPTAGVNPNTGMAMTPIPGQNPTPVTSGSNALAPGIVNMTNPGPSPKPVNYNNGNGFVGWNIPKFFSNYPNSVPGSPNQSNANTGFGGNPFLMNLGGNK